MISFKAYLLLFATVFCFTVATFYSALFGVVLLGSFITWDTMAFAIFANWTLFRVFTAIGFVFAVVSICDEDSVLWARTFQKWIDGDQK